MSDVGAIDQNAAVTGADQPLHQIGDGGLARARRSHDANDLSRRHGQIGLAQDHWPAIVGTVGHALEGDLAGQRRHWREFARRRLGRLVHQFVDPLESRAYPLELMPRARKLTHWL